MSSQPTEISPALYQYILDTAVVEHPLLQDLRAVTSQMPEAMMQISPDQGQFMAMLVKLIGAKRIIEVGVFTGYSSLSMAMAMPDDGRIYACDVSERFTRIAEEYWERARVSEKIELRLAPAIETLQKLVEEGHSGSFDLAFIDADKSNYGNYFELCLALLRPGGIVIVDNVLWGGSVANSEKQDADTNAIRTFNASLKADKRVDFCLATIADGLMLLRKK